MNKEERLPAIKLTIVQYVIVGILLVLLSGLWRLQVIGAQNYRTPRRTKPHPQSTDSCAAR